MAPSQVPDLKTEVNLNFKNFFRAFSDLFPAVVNPRAFPEHMVVIHSLAVASVCLFLCPYLCFSLSLPLCVLSFTPDFTSSWVIRDLTLVTSRGTSFPFTLNVTLPHHMLPLCAQVVPGPSWEETFWVVTLIFTWFVPLSNC